MSPVCEIFYSGRKKMYAWLSCCPGQNCYHILWLNIAFKWMQLGKIGQMQWSDLLSRIHCIYTEVNILSGTISLFYQTDDGQKQQQCQIMTFLHYLKNILKKYHNLANIKTHIWYILSFCRSPNKYFVFNQRQTKIFKSKISSELYPLSQKYNKY